MRFSKPRKRKTEKTAHHYSAEPNHSADLTEEQQEERNHANEERDPEEVKQEQERAAVDAELRAIEKHEEEQEAEERANNSVVAAKFKDRYIAHARELGVKGKAARRSNWDWLAQEIANECLDQKHKIDINKFLVILEQNGIDHTKWDNRARGWEGRLRMTGRVALQRIIADSGVLVIGGVDKPVPQEFRDKYKTKE